MHLEVIVGAVAKKLRAARPEVGEPGDVLLGRRGSCLVQVDRGHAFSLLAVSHRSLVVRSTPIGICSRHSSIWRRFVSTRWSSIGGGSPCTTRSLRVALNRSRRTRRRES